MFGSSSSLELMHMLPTSISFSNTSPSSIYTLSLHDALPISIRDVETPQLARHVPDVHAICIAVAIDVQNGDVARNRMIHARRSEEHTSELQSHSDIVCRLLLEKKNRYNT